MINKKLLNRTIEYFNKITNLKLGFIIVNCYYGYSKNGNTYLSFTFIFKEKIGWGFLRGDKYFEKGYRSGWYSGLEYHNEMKKYVLISFPKKIINKEYYRKVELYFDMLVKVLRKNGILYLSI